MLTHTLRAHTTLSFSQSFKALKTLTWGVVVACEAWSKPDPQTTHLFPIFMVTNCMVG